MRSRLPTAYALTNKQKQAIQTAAEDALAKERAFLMRRFFKLTSFVLNREYGFGRSRLFNIVQEVGKLSAEHAKDEEFWYHLDNVVIDEIGLEFEREQEHEN